MSFRETSSCKHEVGKYRKGVLAETKEVYADYIMNKVIPAIPAKWPTNGTLESRPVLLQVTR